MAATPSTIDTTALQTKHAPQLSGMAERAAKLQERAIRVGYTYQIATEAQEIDTEAKRWIEAFDTETKPIRSRLFEAHRAFTGFCDKMTRGASDARSIARRLIGAYDQEQRRLAEMRRIEEQRKAQEAAEAQRKAEAEELARQAEALAQAGLAEEAEQTLQTAIEVEQSPVIPIAVPEVVTQKIEGASVSYKLVGTVSDPVQLLISLLGPWCDESDSDNPTIDYRPRIDLINELVEFKQSGINAALKRGLELPGVKVEKQAITRNVSSR